MRADQLKLTDENFPAPDFYYVRWTPKRTMRWQIESGKRAGMNLVKKKLTNGKTLSGVRISEATEQKKQQDEQAGQIVFSLMGRTESWEGRVLQKRCELSQKADPAFPVVEYMYNPRGVGESEGYLKTLQDLVDDYFELVKDYIDNTLGGPEHAHKVTINGHDLGADYGLLVAERLHASGYPVNIVCDRGFNLPAMSDEMMNAWQKIPNANKIYITTANHTGRHSLPEALQTERNAHEQLLDQCIQDVETVAASLGDYNSLAALIHGEVPTGVVLEEEQEAAIERLQQYYEQLIGWDGVLMGDQYTQSLSQLRGRTAILNRLQAIKSEVDANVMVVDGPDTSLHRIKNRYGEEGETYLLRWMQQRARYVQRQNKIAALHTEHQQLVEELQSNQNMRENYPERFQQFKAGYQQDLQNKEKLVQATDGLRVHFADIPEIEVLNVCDVSPDTSEAEQVLFLFERLKPYVLTKKDSRFSFVDFNKILRDELNQKFNVARDRNVEAVNMSRAEQIATYLFERKNNYFSQHGVSLNASWDALSDQMFEDLRYKDEAEMTAARQQKKLRTVIEDISVFSPDLQLICLMAIDHEELFGYLTKQKSPQLVPRRGRGILREIAALKEMHQVDMFDPIIRDRLDTLCDEDPRLGDLRTFLNIPKDADQKIDEAIQTGIERHKTASDIKRRANKLLPVAKKAFNRGFKAVQKELQAQVDRQTRVKQAFKEEGESELEELDAGELLQQVTGDAAEHSMKPKGQYDAVTTNIMQQYAHDTDEHHQKLARRMQDKTERAMKTARTQAWVMTKALAKEVADSEETQRAISQVMATSRTATKMNAAMEELIRRQQTNYQTSLRKMQSECAGYLRAELGTGTNVKAGRSQLAIEMNKAYKKRTQRLDVEVLWVQADLTAIEKRIHRFRIIMLIGLGPVQCVALLLGADLGRFFYPNTIRALESAKNLVDMVEGNHRWEQAQRHVPVETLADSRRFQFPVAFETCLNAFEEALKNATTRDDFAQEELACWQAKDRYVQEMRQNVLNHIKHLGPPIVSVEEKQRLHSRLGTAVEGMMKDFDRARKEIQDCYDYKYSKLEYQQTPPGDRVKTYQQIEMGFLPSAESDEHYEDARGALCSRIGLSPTYADTPILEACERYAADPNQHIDDLRMLALAMKNYPDDWFTFSRSSDRFRKLQSRIEGQVVRFDARRELMKIIKIYDPKCPEQELIEKCKLYYQANLTDRSQLKELSAAMRGYYLQLPKDDPSKEQRKQLHREILQQMRQLDTQDKQAAVKSRAAERDKRSFEPAGTGSSAGQEKDPSDKQRKTQPRASKRAQPREEGKMAEAAGQTVRVRDKRTTIKKGG